MSPKLAVVISKNKNIHDHTPSGVHNQIILDAYCMRSDVLAMSGDTIFYVRARIKVLCGTWDIVTPTEYVSCGYSGCQNPMEKSSWISRTRVDDK